MSVSAQKNGFLLVGTSTNCCRGDVEKSFVLMKKLAGNQERVSACGIIVSGLAVVTGRGIRSKGSETKDVVYNAIAITLSGARNLAKLRRWKYRR